MFAVVEIMGHRSRAGAISDATIGGATLLRIEHPTRADHTGEEPLTELYAPSAIFAIRPCSQDEAIKVAAWAWAEPPALAARPLPHELEEMVDAQVENDEAEREEAAVSTWRLVQRDDEGRPLYVAPTPYDDQRLADRAARSLNERRPNPHEWWVAVPEGSPA